MLTKSVRNLSLTIATITIIMASNCQASTQPNTDTLTINFTGDHKVWLQSIGFTNNDGVDISGPASAMKPKQITISLNRTKDYKSGTTAYPSMILSTDNEFPFGGCTLNFTYTPGPSATLGFKDPHPGIQDCGSKELFPTTENITQDSAHQFSYTIYYKSPTL
jgi:hypothetical protein